MEKIKIVFGDITKITDVDVIVNAANKSLLGGNAGVDGAIHKAAGKGLYEECKALNGCETGEAKITDAYNFGCKKIIHTVGPIWEDGYANEKELLKKCYQSCLDLAAENGLRKVAFPAISTGTYNFPIKLAAKIALDTVKHYIEENPDVFDEIQFVLLDWTMMEIYKQVNEYTYLQISVDLKKNMLNVLKFHLRKDGIKEKIVDILEKDIFPKIGMESARIRTLSYEKKEKFVLDLSIGIEYYDNSKIEEIEYDSNFKKSKENEIRKWSGNTTETCSSIAREEFMDIFNVRGIPRDNRICRKIEEILKEQYGINAFVEVPY